MGPLPCWNDRVLKKDARVLVVGSSNTDLVVDCDRLPKPGETLLGGRFQQVGGGKGANQAVAIARAGGKVVFVGARGGDDYGDRALKALKREGIGVSHFKKIPGSSSGIALILVGGASRENMIAVARSSNDRLSAQDVKRAAPAFRKSAVVLAQLEIPLPAVMEASRIAGKLGLPFILNPAPARQLPENLLRKVHTLIPNEHEAALLSGEEDPVRAGAALLARGCRQVLITRGAKGAVLVSREGVKEFPAPKVKPVDTVGAGDCFCGWFALGLAEGLPMEDSVRRALRAASLSVTRKGAQDSMPRRAEV